MCTLYQTTRHLHYQRYRGLLIATPPGNQKLIIVHMYLLNLRLSLHDDKCFGNFLHVAMNTCVLRWQLISMCTQLENRCVRLQGNVSMCCRSSVQMNGRMVGNLFLWGTVLPVVGFLCISLYFFLLDIFSSIIISRYYFHAHRLVFGID